MIGETTTDDGQNHLEFWHTLATRSLCTNNDALHGLLIYTRGDDSCRSYEERVQALKSANLLPRDFNRAPDQAVDRGTVAFAMARVLNLRGGITSSLLGLSPRSAIRALEFRGLLPPSSEGQVVSGAEFVGIVGRIEDERVGDPARKPAAQLPGFSQGGAETRVVELPQPAKRSFFLSVQPVDVSTNRPPASAPIQVVTELAATVTAVQGDAEVRPEPVASWRSVRVGENYTPVAEFRTGPRGAIRLVVAPAQTISVDRLSRVRLSRTQDVASKRVTEISLSYGRTRLDADPAAGGYDAVINSPSTSLAIRGTRVSLLDQAPYRCQAVSIVGRAEFRNVKRRTVQLGGSAFAKVVGVSGSAAETAVAQSVVDPIDSRSRTDAETALINTLVSRGATVSFDRETGLQVLRGGTVPSTEELPSIVPGSLNFVLRWASDVDLNLGVTTQAGAGGELLFPAPGVTLSPSGGRVAFDHRGGKNGGIEVISFGKNAPGGFYSILAFDLSNRPGTQASIDVVIDGEVKNIRSGPIGPNGVLAGQFNANEQLVPSATANSTSNQKSKRTGGAEGKRARAAPTPPPAPAPRRLVVAPARR